MKRQKQINPINSDKPQLDPELQSATDNYVSYDKRTEDILYGYDHTFCKAWAEGEQQMNNLFNSTKWPDLERLLKGLRLRKCNHTTSKRKPKTYKQLFILSTPLLDIIEVYPKLAGKLFYQMIGITAKTETSFSVKKESMTLTTMQNRNQIVKSVQYKWSLLGPSLTQNYNI